MDESNKDQTEQEPIIYSSVFRPYVEPNKGQGLPDIKLLVPSYAKLDTSAKPTTDIVPPAVEEPVKRDWAWLHPVELWKSVFGSKGE